MNKVMLIGNVGQDPEIRYVDQGVAVARLRLATTERGYTLPNGTQVPDHTDWHTVILWRKLAEIVESPYPMALRWPFSQETTSGLELSQKY